MNGRTLRAVFRRLFAHYGPQAWWPAETSFEVMVGAVLTQNTAWSNVERTIAGLRAGGALDPRRILSLPSPTLAETLRPSGYFRVKAERLRSLCRWYLERGGPASIETRDTETIRADLLAVQGIGPETADDILLYALDRPVFVIDAYTRRLFARLGSIEGHEDYEALRARIERSLGPDVPALPGVPRPHRASRQGDLPQPARLRPLLPRRALPMARHRSVPGGRVLKGGANV